MSCELDDILAQVGCPKCGAVISVPFSQIRIHKAAGCGCGALIRLEDETSIGAVQSLMDEANPVAEENDG